MAKRKSSSGGAALQGGAAYQNRIASWLAVEMLAEHEGVPLAPAGKVVFIKEETPESVDDLLVGTDLKKYGFLQAKRSISLSSKANSEFAAVIDQVVRQVVGSRLARAQRPWSRPLDPANDRLVLVTSSLSSQAIKENLRNLLIRISDLTRDQALADAAVNELEHKALGVVVSHVRRCWRDATSTDPSDEDLRLVLSLFFVEVMDVEVDQIHEREAKRTLKSIVLEDRSQAQVAWSSILVACTQMAQSQSGLDLRSLRTKLQDAGIALHGLPSFKRDIERLLAHTDSTIRQLADLSLIRVDGKPVHVERIVMHELRQSVGTASHILVGQPGAGKSGAIHDLAQLLRGQSNDVVCLATDRLEVASLHGLRTEIGLEHDIAEILENWHGSKPGYILVDALDAARGDAAGAAMLSLVRQVASFGGRWKVVASIRKFDLRYSPELQQTFQRNPSINVSTEFIDTEFQLVQHVNVPVFSRDEMSLFQFAAPTLHALYEGAPEAFRELLRVPFNLRLAADLLEGGIAEEELAPIRTQLELLDRYWQRRVLGGEGSDNREAILRRAVQSMVEGRQLKVDRRRALGQGSSHALEQLLSSHVLTEWQSAAATRPDRYSLAFSHNLLFDFAAARLYLPRESEDLAAMLTNDPNLVLVLRPSLVFRCQDLWQWDRKLFWELVFLFARSPGLSPLVQSIPLVTVAENARTVDDIRPLLSALEIQ